MNYEQAWGATLEAWPPGSIIFTNVQTKDTTDMPSTFLPHTLKDVIKAESPMEGKLIVDRDLMITDLMMIRDQANQAFNSLAQFTNKNDLGLSLNKLAGIVDTVNNLIKRYK